MIHIHRPSLYEGATLDTILRLLEQISELQEREPQVYQVLGLLLQMKNLSHPKLLAVEQFGTRIADLDQPHTSARWSYSLSTSKVLKFTHYAVHPLPVKDIEVLHTISVRRCMVNGLDVSCSRDGVRNRKPHFEDIETWMWMRLTQSVPVAKLRANYCVVLGNTRLTSL